MDQKKIEVALSDEALRLEEDCKYSSKGHYVASSFWARVQIILGVPATASAAISGSFAFNGVLDMAGSLAMMSAALTAVLTFLNSSEKSSSHLLAGNQYNALQNETRIYREIELASISQQQTSIEKLNNLSTRRDKLNQTSLQIPGFAFRIARKGIADGEADYSIDKGS